MGFTAEKPARVLTEKGVPVFGAYCWSVWTKGWWNGSRESCHAALARGRVAPGTRPGELFNLQEKFRVRFAIDLATGYSP
jgi:hypothetical protein